MMFIGKAADCYFEGHQNVYEKVEPLFSGVEEVTYVESWQRRKDGEKRLLAWWCRVLKDDTGNIKGVLSTARDITDHKEAETALKESQEKFSRAFNASPDMMAISTKKEVRFAEVNDSFTGISGYTREEIIGQTASNLNLLPLKQDGDKIRQLLEEKGRARGEEVILRKKSGELRLIQFSADPLTINGEEYLLVTCADVFEQKQYQEFLQTLSRGYPLGIFILQDDELKFTNPQFQKITGYSREELKGKEFFNVITGLSDDAVKALSVFTSAEENSCPYENRIINKNGLVKWVMQTFTHVHYEGRAAILGNLMDITERKYLEKKLVEYAELSKMKSDLLSRVSHELRTPLATIKGYSTLILDYYSRLTPEELSEYFKAIDGATDSLSRLVDNLLDTSRMDAGLLKLEKSSVNIGQFIKEIVREANMRTGHRHIAARVAKGLPPMKIDSGRIRQALDNFIDNANKYSPPGTEITISARQENNNLLISVTDQGPGIPDEELNSIFERMRHIEQKAISGSVWVYTSVRN